MTQPLDAIEIDDDPPATPRWVLVAGGIGLVVVLLFVFLHLTGAVSGH